MGLDVVNRDCLEPIAQIGLEAGKGSVMDSEGVLKTVETDGVVDIGASFLHSRYVVEPVV